MKPESETTYSVYEQAKELTSEIIKMQLFDPRNQTDRDVMAATLSPFLQRALMAGSERDRAQKFHDALGLIVEIGERDGRKCFRTGKTAHQIATEALA